MDDASRSVGIIMGSQSDWDTMQHSATTLERLGIGYETRIVSAHRTPDRLFDYARTAKSRELRLIIAGAGGAAPPPGQDAGLTLPPGPRRADRKPTFEGDRDPPPDLKNPGENPARILPDRTGRCGQCGAL